MLRPEHAEHLALFRIPPEMLEAAGVRSVSDPDTRELLGVHGRRGEDLSGIFIPYRHPLDGQRTGARVRLDHPIDRTKYLMEAACRHLFFPSIFPPEWFTDVSIPAVFVEAEKSALALWAWAQRSGLKMIFIATGGCWGWRRTVGRVETRGAGYKSVTGPSPDLDLIRWGDRDAIILFDSNAAVKFEIDMARHVFAKHLGTLNAKVLLAEVPVIAGVNGPDDFVAISTDDEVGKRIFSKAVGFTEKKDDDITQAVQLVRSVTDIAALFHSPDHVGYAVIPVGEHEETWRISSKIFRQYICHWFYLEQAQIPGAQAVLNAIHLLEAKANFEGPRQEVFVRVAEFDGALWLDLANESWQAVCITKEGWTIVDKPPVHFRRSPGALPLPTPVHGGKVEELFNFLNLRNDSDRLLVAAYLVAALRAKGPYPILLFVGEHGTAKSTACRVCRKVVDPFVAPIRTLPTDERDLQIAAHNSHVLCFDNISAIEPRLSDALCRLATGGGLAVRSLYTDSDEVIFDAQRPILLNSIDNVAERGDLADRAIVVDLEEITKVRDEEEFWRSFSEAHARILGALLDAVVVALAKIDSTVIEHKPRMADFARWATAAETGLGFPEGSFLSSYTKNREASNETALEASVVVEPLKAFMQDRKEWEGTCGDLLAEIRERVTDELARSKAFPKTPRKLSSDLRRLAPNLRRVDIDIRFPTPEGHDRRRVLRVARKPSAPFAPSVNGDSAGVLGDDAGPADRPHKATNGEQPSAPIDSKQSTAADAYDADGIPVTSAHRGKTAGSEEEL